MGGEHIEDDRVIAEVFNEHFISVGENLASDIGEKRRLITDRHMSCPSLFLIPITDSEIEKNIHKLKNNSAPGQDLITTRSVKELKSILSNPLAFIFNLCLEQGKFPEALKRSIVTPVYKGGNKLNVNNYRPISVVSNFAKLFEMSIKERLNRHLTKNKILSGFQFGFREGVGTEDAIYCVTKNIYNALNNGKKSLAIYLDLARAFDTVSHGLLLEKLHDYGVRGIAAELFESYLEGREQCVRVDGDVSGPRIVSCGVPQGTVLGPILFSIYINELLFLNVNAKIISYADDTVLLLEGSKWEEVKEAAVSAFSMVQQWLNQNLLSLNLNKTNVMCYSIYNLYLPNFQNIQLHTYNCLLNNKLNCQCTDRLVLTSTVKYLGITLDQNLKWTEHIKQLNLKIRKLIWKFYQLRDIFPVGILRVLYGALAESIIRYGISVWGSAFPTNIEMLKVAQRFLLKVMMKKPRLHSTEMLYQDSRALNINQLYIRAAVVYTYKNSDLRKLYYSSYKTRSQTNRALSTPLMTRTTTQRFLTYYGPKLFNMLPLEIRDINDMKFFNRRVTKYVSEHESVFVGILQSG